MGFQGLRWWWLLCALFSGIAAAHENRLLQVDIDQVGLQSYRVALKVPPSVAADNQPRLLMPESCQLKSASLYECDQPLARQVISLRYAQHNPSVSSLIQYRLLNGQQHHAVLAPEQAQWRVPEAESPSAVATEYFGLGVEHILRGWDHLLFLLCLMLLAGDLRRLLWTVTGFTLAHSLTLVATALGWIGIPIAAVEAIIALSILFLARELVNDRRDTLTFRYPLLVASSFGLVHGFGFASFLNEVGLPQTAKLTGLLFFNLGVEAGQLLIVVCALLGCRLLLRLPVSMASWTKPGLYLAGSCAGFWFVERCLAVVW